MVDELRETMTAYADQVSVPPDLLDRVEAQARGIRRGRRVLVAGATALSLALVAAAVVLPASLRTGRSDGGSVLGGSGGTGGIPACGGTAAAPGPAAPANVLPWPCRGGDPALLPTARRAWQADHGVPDTAGGGARVLWNGQDPLGHTIGVFQFWSSTASSLASTVVVDEQVGTRLDVVLPGDAPAVVRAVSGTQPGGAVTGDSEGLVVVAAPDTTAASYDDGRGHRTPLALADGVAVALRAVDRADTADSVTVTNPRGTFTVGVREQEAPTAAVPKLAGRPEAEAVSTLAAAGLRAVTTVRPQPAGAAPGTVVSLSIPAGQRVPTGSEVGVVVGGPPQPMAVGTPSPGAATPAAAPGLFGADGLFFEKPWPFWGDKATADAARAAVPGLVPLWSGTAGDTVARTVGLLREGPGAGQTFVVTVQPGADGRPGIVDRQTLRDGLRVYAAVIPGAPRPQALILGPPGTASIALARQSGPDLERRPATDGAALFDLDAGTLSFTGAQVQLRDAGGAVTYDGPVGSVSTGSRD